MAATNKKPSKQSLSAKYPILRQSTFVVLALLFAGAVVAKVAEHGIPRRASHASGNTAITANTSSHDIASRVVDGKGQLYDKRTGQIFMARGNNYVRYANVTDPWSHTAVFVDATFDPNVYDSARIQVALKNMSQFGYNSVRVSVSEIGVGSSTGTGLSTAYLANVTDFLTRAKSFGIYPVVSIANLPKLGGYYQGPYTDLESFNWMYLSPTALEAKKRFVKDFINGLKALNAPLGQILFYEVGSEQGFLKNAKPLTLQSGVVQTIAGNFDMSSQTQKMDMLDKNLVAWMNGVDDALHSVDPQGILGMEFFPNIATPSTSPFIIRTRPALLNPEQQGPHDGIVISASLYPEWGRTMKILMDDFGVTSTNSRKPIVMLETGISKGAYQNVNLGIPKLMQWQTDSCTYNVSGWFHWTWDSTEQTAQWWTATEANNAINNAVAPSVRPNPCGGGNQPPPPPAPTPIPPPVPSGVSLRYLKVSTDRSDSWVAWKELECRGSDGAVITPVSASATASRPENLPAYVYDQNLSTTWSSGKYSAAITLDYGRVVSCSSIRLMPANFPNPIQTTHQLSASDDNITYKSIRSFPGPIYDGQWLEYRP